MRAWQTATTGLRSVTPSRSEKGSSVVEVVATLSIMTIVMATVYQGFASTQNAIVGSEERLRNLDEARVLMAATSKDIRTAVRLSAGSSPFLYASGNETTFYANLDTVDAPKKVSIHIDSEDRLIEEVWTADESSVAPDYTYTDTPRVRFVGRYVDNSEAEPLFTYLDANGAVLSATPLSPTDLLAVRAVRIGLVVKKESGWSMRSTSLVNRVRLPNLDYNVVAG
ncbi:MAG: hypothetical protein M5T61_10995 [Acidimicrobiia bacterium]|nr:hypothetical protein [Acidimicrobiia bacterium]